MGDGEVEANGERGLGLLEVMVALGIVGVGLYAVAQIVITSNQATVNAARMTEVNQTSQFIHNLMNATDICSANFKNFPIKAELNTTQDGPTELYGVDESGNKGEVLIRVNQTPIARAFKISAIKIILQGLVSSAPNRHTYWAKLITNYRSEQSTIGGQVFYREHDFYPVLDQKTGNTSIVACNPQLGTGSGGGGGGGGGGGTYQSGQTYGSCIKYERVGGGATASKPALVVNQTRWGSADCGCEAGFTRIETGQASEMIQWEGYKIYYYACIKD